MLRVWSFAWCFFFCLMFLWPDEICSSFEQVSQETLLSTLFVGSSVSSSFSSWWIQTINLIRAAVWLIVEPDHTHNPHCLDIIWFFFYVKLSIGNISWLRCRRWITVKSIANFGLNSSLAQMGWTGFDRFRTDERHTIHEKTDASWKYYYKFEIGLKIWRESVLT